MIAEEIRAARGCLAGLALCCLSAVLVVGGLIWWLW